MLQELYTLKNLITKTHGSLMTFQNEEHAKDEISKFLKKEIEQNDFDPAKFELWHSGEYDNTDGTIYAGRETDEFDSILICNCSELLSTKDK